jgi:hypothetical protein
VTIRSRNETVVFNRPFHLKGVERLLPAGAYEVVSDDEMIEGLSFPCYRRVSTMIMVPGEPPNAADTEMITISAIDLSDAQRNDTIASRA